MLNCNCLSSSDDCYIFPLQLEHLNDTYRQLQQFHAHNQCKPYKPQKRKSFYKESHKCQAVKIPQIFHFCHSRLSVFPIHQSQRRITADCIVVVTLKT